MKSSLSQNSLDVFNKARINSIFCDALLKTEDGGQFSIHKCILVLCSPYFDTLFTKTAHGRKESSFLIPGVSKQELNVVIKFSYTHDITLDFRNIEGILSAADQFNILDLIHCCSRFMMDNMDAKNCLRIRDLAERFCLTELVSECNQYLARNFTEVIENSEELTKISGPVLISVLSDDELNVKHEELVWETVIRWIREDEATRKHCIVDLMKCVRLGLVNEDYFMEKIRNHPYVLANSECVPVISETLTFISDRRDMKSISENSNELHTRGLACPRIPNEMIFVVGGWSSAGPINCIETYDIKADVWRRMEDISLPELRACHGCVAIDDVIYVIGGFNGKLYFSDCCCFNVVTKQWKVISPMHCKRSYVSVVVLNNSVYAMGGYNGSRRQNTVEKYERFNNQWTMIAPMHCHRSDASAAVLNGCVYIVGGFNGSGCMNSAEYYFPSVNQWTLISPMRNRRSGQCCVSHKGQLYVLGGFDGMERIQSVEEYNPRNGTWSYVAGMLTERSNFSAAILDGKIFSIGGHDGDSITKQTEYYDESSKDWKEAADMNLCRFSHAICVMKNIPNIRDYLCKERSEPLRRKIQ